jgi:AmmeMemoRadiSam system protein A
MELSPAHQRILLDIARTCIRHALVGAADQLVPARGPQSPSIGPATRDQTDTKRQRGEEDPSDPILNMPAGCFVSLHDRNSHRLRGCVGRLDAKTPLIRCIYEMSGGDGSGGVLSDPRFRTCPVTLSELPRLDLELSILSPMKPAPTPLDFDPLNDGIYLTCFGRCGTFLPQVGRQTGWTREQLLSRLCTEKLGLPPTSWQDPSAHLLTYQAQVIGPVPFEEPTGYVRIPPNPDKGLPNPDPSGQRDTKRPPGLGPPDIGGFGSGNIFRI